MTPARRHTLPSLLRVAALLLALLPSPSARATRAVEMDWRTLSTAHFDVHYYVGGEELAHRLAAIAEEAWTTLVPVFEFTPSDRCQLVLTDHLDAANGLTSTLPYDKIVIYAYPPEAHGELGSYDDYLHMLFFHEYAHLLHLNTIGGVPEFVNTVLGKTMLPNSILPSWYIEGIATLIESRVSGRGRVESARTEMILRAAILGDRWLPLEKLTGAPLVRPRASGFYLYGGEFLTWVGETVGFERVIAFQHAYGRRLIPYGLNLLGEDTLGAKFVDLYAEWSAVMAARAEQVRAEVLARGPLVTGRPLTSSGEEHDGPRFSPDGRRLAYVEYTGHDRQAIRVMDVASGTARTVAECDGTCLSVAWFPDGRSLLLDRYAWDGPVYYRRDLFRVDVESGLTERLTHGARVREPDVDATSGRVVYVSTEFGRTWLVVHDLADGTTRTIVPPNRWDQLEAPRWSPDGTQVAYTAWTEGDGRRDVFVVAADGSAPPRRLTWDDAHDLQATWSPDGTHLLWSADPGGSVYDVHALRLADGQRFRVTNVVTGAFQPDVDPAGENLVFTVYAADGYDIHLLPFRPAEWAPLGVATPAPPSRPPYEPPPLLAAPEDGDYAPWGSIWPHRIEPTWYLDQTGFANVGLKLSGSDALDHHTWSASLDYAIQSQRLSEALVYVNRQLPVDLGLTFSHFSWDRLYYQDGIALPFEERVLYGSVDSSLPFPDVRSGFSIGLGYALRWAGDVDRPPLVMRPDDLVPYIPSDGLLSGVYLSWAYSDTTRTLYGIDNEEGRSLWLSVKLNHPALGSDHQTVELRWQWREHLELPWLRHHVLNFRLTHGIAAGHPEFRAAYSLGGIPPQDLFVSIANQAHMGGLHLRGYRPGRFSGDQFYLATLEYRFPLLDIFRGVGTFPVWASRLTGALFADAGDAFRGPLREAEPNVGAGVELRLQTELFFSFAASFRLGYAYGFMEDGEHQVYFVLGGWP
jgi:hypothetical protein